MKTIPTVEGKMYCVSATIECTITSQSGTVLGTASPGTPFWFQAQKGDTTTLSDDAAEYSASRFNSAPQQQLAIIGVLGGCTPAWFKALEDELTALLDGSPFEVAWLSAENTLVVHTDRVSDELLAAVKATAEAAMPDGAALVQYNHDISIPWRDINKYAACVTRADMTAVNPDYQTDLTSDGAWIYPLPAMKELPDFRKVKALKKFICDLPSVTKPHINYSGFLAASNVELVRCSFKVNPYINNTFGDAPKMVEYIGPLGVKKVDTDCFWHNYSLRVFKATLENAGNLRDFFDGTQLEKESALRALNSVPVCTGNYRFSIGIHVDYQNDEEVLAAIAYAESQGWSMGVQWNGTPTSTASTMAMGSLIYARMEEKEMPDGTTVKYLGWGHYMTDPTGYETFRSLESAYRYFGIPMPEDLTNN